MSPWRCSARFSHTQKWEGSHPISRSSLNRYFLIIIFLQEWKALRRDPNTTVNVTAKSYLGFPKSPRRSLRGNDSFHSLEE